MRTARVGDEQRLWRKTEHAEVQFLIFLGRAVLILRHDGKNAIKSLAQAEANAREHETQDEHSSSSLGVGEIRIMRLGGSFADASHDRFCGHHADGEARSVG